MDQLPGVAAQFAGTLAVHTAKVVVGRRVDMFCKWLCCKLPGCSSPGPPAPSAEERARLQIQELIRQSLVDLPHAVTSDFDMKSLDALIQMAENDDNAWVDIILELVPTLPLANPLSAVLIPMILDTFPIPSTAIVAETTRRLLEAFRQATRVGHARNCLVIWGILAGRMAGRCSEILMTDEVAVALLNALRRDDQIVVTLYSLLAVEKFAQTGANKKRLVAMGAPTVIYALEKRYCSRGRSGRSSEALATTPRAGGSVNRALARQSALSRGLCKVEVGFCAMWALDNMFPCEGRAFAMERTDVSTVNVMLDPRDATSFLKLSPDGLEIRNDALSFESVRATCCAQGGGQWYYEVTVFTGGIMQLGWATEECTYQSEEGFGIGDDAHSLSYDGCRQLLWHAQRHRKHWQPKWKPGDVLGVYLDLDLCRVSFATNGAMMEWLPLPTHPSVGLYPAASLMTFQHVRFNFGNEPYQHPPPAGYQDLNQVGSMTSEEKRIVPRLVMLQQLRDELQEEEISGATCQICFAATANVRHVPCNHTDFCMECSMQCTRCPMCRAEISEREEVPVEE